MRAFASRMRLLIICHQPGWELLIDNPMNSLKSRALAERSVLAYLFGKFLVSLIAHSEGLRPDT